MSVRTSSGIQWSGGGVGLKSIGILAQSGTPSGVTGTSAETALATITVPAGTLGPHGRIVIETLWSMTNNADTKTAFIRIAGTAILGWGATTSSVFRAKTEIRNAGSRTSQVFPANGTPLAYSDGLNGSAYGTASIDFTTVQTISINGQVSVVTDTITLLGYTVQVTNP